jgi:hypothetical protein
MVSKFTVYELSSVKVYLAFRKTGAMTILIPAAARSRFKLPGAYCWKLYLQLDVTKL